MAGTLEKPPVAEQKPEEAQEAAPEMAAEEEISPEAMEAIVTIDKMKTDLAELEIKEAKGEITEEERELLRMLREDMENLGDDFEIIGIEE